jgi:hypothetical protein
VTAWAGDGGQLLCLKAAVLSSSLQATMGKSGRVVVGGGVLFIARGVQGIGGKDSRPLLSLKSVLIQVLVGI